MDKSQSKKIAIIHTSFVSVEHLKTLFSEIIPEAEISHIVDDSLLKEVMENGGITPGIIRRMSNYAQQAETMGVDAIFNQCSSVGEAADIASQGVSPPMVKVDQAMAEKAVKMGKRIAVVATVASTMAPSCRLVERAAEKAGKTVEIVPALVDGALDILMKEQNRSEHNRLVKEKIESLEHDVDVFVLAQGSMVVLLNELKHIKKPVLSSPRLGVESLRDVLALPKLDSL